MCGLKSRGTSALRGWGRGMGHSWVSRVLRSHSTASGLGGSHLPIAAPLYLLRISAWIVPHPHLGPGTGKQLSERSGRGRALHPPRGPRVTVATTRVRRLREERARGPPAPAPALARAVDLRKGEDLACSGLLENLNSSRRLVVSEPLGTVGPATTFTLRRGHSRSASPGDLLCWRMMNTH